MCGWTPHWSSVRRRLVFNAAAKRVFSDSEHEEAVGVWDYIQAHLNFILLRGLKQLDLRRTQFTLAKLTDVISPSLKTLVSTVNWWLL